MQPEPVFQEHPVPQNIASYQFRLIGDMTIKQFFQLAGGALISLLIYASPFPGFIKWPFIIFFALAGAAFAFLPLEERPLEQWVAAFFRSVYSPTLYYWQKSSSPPVYFLEETAASPATTLSAPSSPSSATTPTYLSNLEKSEKGFLTRISSLFGQPVKPTPALQSLPPTLSSTSMPSATPVPSVIPAVSLPQVLTVPTPAPPTVKPQGYQQPTPTPQTPPSTPSSASVPSIITPTAPPPAQAAVFSPDAAPPNPPTQPNLITGQVMDAAKHIVEGAILEITDPLGRPVRALKTNKAGHFLIVTPLTNGRYQITIEKDGLKFNTLELEAKGALIPPIAIQAANTQNPS